MSYAIEVQQLSKHFGSTQALSNVCIKVNPGDMVALIGPSGSGKSTLLRHIAGLEIANGENQGTISIDGKLMQYSGRLSKSARQIRGSVGVIFQQFNLIGRLNVLTNVLLGSLGKISSFRGTLGLFNQQEKLRALEALDRVGLKEIAYQRASTLSGGQQQRVAIARTLMQQASIILADEPIASLDPKSAKTVMKHLRSLRKEDGKTVIVTLHQVEYARKYCRRVIALVDGQIAFDGKAKELTDSILEQLYGTTMFEDDDEFDIESPISDINLKLAAGLSG